MRIRFSAALFFAFTCAHTSMLQAELNDSKSLLLDEFMSIRSAPPEESAQNRIIAQMQEAYLKRLKLDLIPDSYQHLVTDYKSQLKELLSYPQSNRLTSEAVKQYYLDYYSEAELVALIRFYQSDVGQKHLNSQPPIVVSDEQQREMQERSDAIERLTEHFLFQLRENGFESDFVNAKGMRPMKAIELSEMFGPFGFDGVFQFEIKAANIHNNILYINSEKDYRDRRCLTVRLKSELVSEFINQYGENVSEALVGKSLLVKGTAKRQVIKAIGPDNEPMFPYYQTHIAVDDLSKLFIGNKASTD
ncbi:DUF2059 domain-containing protein [Planctobacterium marinum]|uniref:DUF2059 domain-containing protein n=1 Tax=Planctobacterium marinum TaxID=1631968 RepID=UPI001E434980|nr:DUF2059 domain-containing protein [Planctobacterium marinum]MCC2605068.1 DUF2059 domain-containing protein [Planctobacterium marinum]